MFKKCFVIGILLLCFCFFMSGVSAESFTYDEMASSAEDVFRYTQENSKVPKSVTINGKTASDENYLNMLTNTVVKISDGNKAGSTVPNRKAPSKPQGTGKGTLTKSQYIAVAKNINSFYSSNGQAPNFAYTSVGEIRYESLIYGFSKIMYAYERDGTLPSEMSFPLKSGISSSGITVDTTPPSTSINLGGGWYNTVKTVTLTASDNKDPNPSVYYKINTGDWVKGGKSVSISLKQGITTLYYKAKDSKGNVETQKSVTYKIDLTSPVVSKNLAEGFQDFNSILILNANDNMDTNPIIYYNLNNKGWISSSKSIIILLNKGTNSISYYAKDAAGNTRPVETITYFTYGGQILDAVNSVKVYVETYNQLPSQVLLGQEYMSTQKFLKILSDTILLIQNNSSFPSISNEEFLDSQINITENSTNGIFSDYEYIEIAQYIKNFMDTNNYAPTTVSTSLGQINFESALYMFSKLLTTYDSSSNSIDDSFYFIPWLAVSNPEKFYNFNSQKIFNDLQSAINDLDTLNGDTIYVGKGVFVGNFIVNKELTISSLFGNSTFTALDSTQPVFSIVSNLVEIIGLNINGSTGSSAIELNRVDNITISNNNITNNDKGISTLYSNNLYIEDNNIFKNNIGIYTQYLNSLNVFGNNISNNNVGIETNYANDISFVTNIFSNNDRGVISYFTSGNMSFNAIFNNSGHGLYSLHSFINVSNNWWGSNNLIVSYDAGSHIYKFNGDVNHDSWLVLKNNVERDFTQSTETTGVYIVTADLTYNNNGEDTSDEGNLPNYLPINFSTTRGTINSTMYTSVGKAKATLKITNNGQTNIATLFNNQSVLSSNNLNVTVKGVYNNRTKTYFDTIQLGIDNAINGDTLIIARGFYKESLLINKKINLISSGNVEIQASNQEYAIIINNGGSNSTIKGINIEGNNYPFGILLNSTNFCIINNNNISGTIYGIFILNSNNSTISNNKIKNNRAGIYSYNSTENLLEKNYIIQNFNGIYEIESNDTIKENTIKESWIGLNIRYSNGNILENNIINNVYGINFYGSLCNNLNNNFSENEEDEWYVNTTDIIMANDDYDCGPAVLATLFKKFGINVTINDLILSTNTKLSGTTMYDMVETAINHGLIASGVILDIEYLKSGNIIYLTIDDIGHFCILKNITDTHVYLADPTLGNINLTLEKFLDYYTGYAIIITNDSQDTQLTNLTLLTNEEMQIIEGKRWVKKKTGYKIVSGFINKRVYGLHLRPVTTAYGVKWSQWKLVKGYYYTTVWGKKRVAVYKWYWISDGGMTSRR